MSVLVLGGVIAAFALALGFYERRHRAEPQMLGKGVKAWGVAVGLFACDALGVLASFYISRPVLQPGQRIVVLSLIVAAANFAGALEARPARARLRPADLFQFFKDGLLWPAVLPALAKLMGTTPLGQ